jgi:hypothetical protein
MFRLPGMPAGMGVPFAVKPPLTQLMVTDNAENIDPETSMLSGLSTDGSDLTLMSKPAKEATLTVFTV